MLWLRLILGTRFGSRFLKNVSWGVHFFVVYAWHQNSQQDTQKNCAPEILIFSALKLFSCRLVVFTDMSTYILTEGKNFKTSLIKNYATAWESCNIFTKKCWTRTAWKVSKYGVFSGPYFPTFGLNTEKYGVSLRIQPKWGKIRTRKNSVFGHSSRSDDADSIYGVCIL